LSHWRAVARQSTDETRVENVTGWIETGWPRSSRQPRPPVRRISDWVEGDGQLSSRIFVPAELGRGDLRALYLGWLLCAQSADLGRKADAKAFWRRAAAFRVGVRGRFQSWRYSPSIEALSYRSQRSPGQRRYRCLGSVSVR
jgi:hypothetical protein